ncbi:hypothetical protein BdWA1_001585 [Babesia duncani]|uniref:Uncharacterized protein n=1 Tax=Babesia duncani TaxID=323732 RepID=A0AAD9PK56_9APIC|nr:hypothetical protein BdWA1_001585 [Babesia duncani]
MEKYAIRAMLFFVFHVICGQAVELKIEISSEDFNHGVSIETVSLSSDVKEIIFTPLVETDFFTSVTQYHIEIDKSLVVKSDEITILYKTLPICIRIRIPFDINDKDSTLPPNYKNYYITGDQWIPVSSRTYLENRRLYMKNVQLTLPCKNDKFFFLSVKDDGINCIPRYEQIWIDEILIKGKTVWKSSLETLHDKITSVLYKIGTSNIIYIMALSPDEILVIKKYVIVNDELQFVDFGNINSVMLAKKAYQNVKYHYRTMRRIRQIALNFKSSLVIPPVLPKPPEAASAVKRMKDKVNDSAGTSRHHPIIVNPIIIDPIVHYIVVDLLAATLPDSRYTRWIPLTEDKKGHVIFTADAGCAFRKATILDITIFDDMNDQPFYMEYNALKDYQTLYTVSAYETRSTLFKWEKDGTWKSMQISVKDGHFYNLSLDISVQADARFYDILDNRISGKGIVIYSPRSPPFKIISIFDGNNLIVRFFNGWKIRIEHNNETPQSMKVTMEEGPSDTSNIYFIQNDNGKWKPNACPMKLEQVKKASNSEPHPS